MFPKLPKRSVDLKDIFLIFLAWLISKFLDTAWDKTRAKLRRAMQHSLARTFLAFLSLRLLQFVGKLLDYNIMRCDSKELKRLILNAKRQGIRHEAIFMLRKDEWLEINDVPRNFVRGLILTRSRGLHDFEVVFRELIIFSPTPT